MMKTTKRSLLIWIWLHKKPCEWLPRNIQQITPDRLWNTSNTSDLTCRNSIQSWSFVYTRWLPYFVVEYTWNCKAYSKKRKMQSVNKTWTTRHEYNLMSLKSFSFFPRKQIKNKCPNGQILTVVAWFVNRTQMPCKASRLVRLV